MLKYFHIIKFLMTHDLTKLKEFWSSEFIHGEFSWRKVLTRIIKNQNDNYYFWWRLANEMFTKGTEKQKRVANRINIKLIRKYNVEIGLGAKIGVGLKIIHFSSIIINSNVDIGTNFEIKQCSTIGVKKGIKKISIGNNVNFGASCCVISDNLSIGSNVTIGAMSFINKDIPDNCTVFTKKTNEIIIH